MTFSTNLEMYLDTVLTYLSTYLRAGMSASEAHVCCFSSLLEIWRARLSAICPSEFFALLLLSSQLRKMPVKKEGRANCCKAEV